MTKLNDSIELSKLECGHFMIEGMTHLGIEDSWHPTATLKAFFKTGSANVAAVLDKAEVTVDKRLIQELDNLEFSRYMDFSRYLNDVRCQRSGIVLHIRIPTCKPTQEGHMNTTYAEPHFAFVYGDDYEAALYKSADFAREAVDAQLALRKVMYVGSTNTLTAHIEDNPLINRIKQRLTALFV